MLRLERDIDFSTCERIISNVASRNRDEYITLDLATNIFFSSRPAGTAAIIQAIVSWARSFENPKLLTHAVSLTDRRYSKDSQEAIRSLLRKPHGLVAALMADDILSVDQIDSVRAFAYDFAKTRVETMEGQGIDQIDKGHSATLICVDHSTKAFLSHFYHPEGVEPRLRGEIDFIGLVRRILDVSMMPSHRKRVSKTDERSLGIILRELISNTHDHARADANGRPYKKSVRGLYSRFHYLTPEMISRSAAGLPALETFLKSYIGRWRGQSLQFLELSVFDSGPGFAASISGHEISSGMTIDDEFLLTQKCFLKHVTSKNSSVYGVGLYRLEDVLRSNCGFMRLRTGRLDLYKSYADSDRGGRPSALRDAKSQTSDISPAAPAKGVAVTIVIPVGLP